jgi:hypothetical protein
VIRWVRTNPRTQPKGPSGRRRSLLSEDDTVTKAFLEHPQRMLAELLDEDTPGAGGGAA